MSCHQWPWDHFTHGSTSAVLATAQKFPKLLSQEIASDFWHPQHWPQTNILFNFPEKPQGAKIRGAEVPLEVNSRHPNSLPCPNWVLFLWNPQRQPLQEPIKGLVSHSPYKVPSGEGNFTALYWNKHFIETSCYRTDKSAKAGNTQHANPSCKNTHIRVPGNSYWCGALVLSNTLTRNLNWTAIHENCQAGGAGEVTEWDDNFMF